jgi:hypothetical protein
MKAAAVVLLIGILGVATAALISHHHGAITENREVIATKVAARLTQVVECSPKFGGATSVHRNGSQVSVWVLDTLPASARLELDRVVAVEAKPLKVELIDLKLIDVPTRYIKW